jgi:hypothetical protein
MSMQRHETKSVAPWAYALAGTFGLTGLGAGVGLALLGNEAALIGPFLVLMALLMANFASLTVTVDEREVRWRFGRGPVGRRVPLERVRGVEVRHSPWYWGWGIRWTPHGWLWRSHGLDAVWLELDDGRHVGVGTQDPAGLAQALRSRLD